MKKIIFTVVFTLSASFAIAGEELKVGVKGMVCAFCAQGIEKKFKAQAEVEKIEVSLVNKFVKLTFKDGARLANDKVSEILKDAGYEAVFDTPIAVDAKNNIIEKSKLTQPEKKK